MRRYHVLAAAGIVFLVAGFALLAQTGVYAQDAAPPEPLADPPYLAEYYLAWVESPHADYTAEAFVHWDEEGEIPVECAACHSEGGYLDFMGEDGSEFGAVDAPAALGSVVTCDVCHNPTARDLTTVTFPSGVSIEDDGGSSRCMHCHQGRSSTDTVNAGIEAAGLTEEPNTVNAELRFVNIHYYAAAASLYGSVARGGYQYDGMAYQQQNEHVEGFATCADCHDPHTLELDVAACSTCHVDVESEEDLRFIRMNGSLSDYDGDDDVFEGIAEEIEGLQEILYGMLQAYARDVGGTPIVYDSHAYPYFFIDSNDNGETDADEAAFPNAYNAFTPALLRAAYNYQVSLKDPGGYAHNPQYHIQLLHDSIMDLGMQMTEMPEELALLVRDDPGHFMSTAAAFRDWDEDGEVPGRCARCHTEEGLPFFIENGVNIAVEPSSSLACSTCHDSLVDFTLYVTDEVPFPSGAAISFGEGDENNLCLYCHQGRESTVSVNNAIRAAGVGDDEVSERLTFRNIHYFAAGTTLFGAEAQGAYQYEGREYSGRFMHDGEEAMTCTDCHDSHTGENDIALCVECHEQVDEDDPTSVRLIRMVEDVEVIDYDGDGDAEEPIHDEIIALEEALLVAVQAYAADVVGTPIAYDSHSHPYWFIDTNANGVADPEEVNGDNRYATWTPTLLRAAYNYQYIAKDPGGYAHNADYELQVLYDSIEAIGGDVSTYTRPPVQASES